MAIEIITAQEALNRGRTNREKTYPSPKRDAHRLHPFAEVASAPSFRFDPDAKVFTAGSCFARNIERALRKMDYNIVSSDPDFYNPFPDRQPFHRFNKYTIHSIANEIEWALGDRPMDAKALLCPTKDGLYCDTQTLGDSLSAPLEEMVRFRETYNAKFATVADADVVMLTLGLVECWHDEATGEYLNRFPGMTALKSNPDRFTLHVLDYQDIYDGLVRTYDTIARHNDRFKMLVTVSPVPLDRTFRDSDILVANCYSKSVQRAAVEAFVQSHPVDYFPSYEIVTLTDSAYAWGDQDYRHVRGEMVDRLMGRVLERYTDVTEKQSAQKTRGDIGAYLKSGDLPKAQAALDAHTEAFDLSLVLMPQAADLAYRQGDLDRTIALLRDLIARIKADPEAADRIFETPSGPVANRAGSFLDQAVRMQAAGPAETPQMSKLRAVRILQDLQSADPDNADLTWLADHLAQADTGTTEARKREDTAYLAEMAAVARLRDLQEPADLPAAKAVAQDAAAKLGFCETVQWEMALLYRKHDQLDAALDLFAEIGRHGGARAVQAVKHAMPLARRLKKHDLVAQLADDVAKTL